MATSIAALLLACSPPEAPPAPELPSASTPPTWRACRGAYAVWYEAPMVFRVANGRPFGVAGDRIATEFVCAGVVRADVKHAPTEQFSASLAEVRSKVEDRYRTVLANLTYPESSPRSFCIVLFNTTNLELGRSFGSVSVWFRPQKAFAVLGDGQLVAQTPPPLHEINPTRPGVRLYYEEMEQSIAREPLPLSRPVGPPWLEPDAALIECEDTEIVGSVP